MMSSLGNFAKNYVKSIGLTSLDILRRDIAKGAAGVAPSSSSLVATNIAEQSIKLGCYFEQAFAITAKATEAAQNNNNNMQKPSEKVNAAADYSSSNKSRDPNKRISSSTLQSQKVYDLTGNPGEVGPSNDATGGLGG